MPNEDKVFQALLVESTAPVISQGGPSSAQHATYDFSITQKGQAFFSGTLRYYDLIPTALAAIRAEIQHHILDRLARCNQPATMVRQPDPTKTIYQWESIDLKGVFLIEDGLADVLTALISFGRQQLRAKGEQLEEQRADH